MIYDEFGNDSLIEKGLFSGISYWFNYLQLVLCGLFNNQDTLNGQHQLLLIFLLICGFFVVWVLSWFPLALLILTTLFKWKPPQPLPPQAKLPLLVPLYLLAPWWVWSLAQLTGTPIGNYGVGSVSRLFASLLWGVSGGVLGLAVIFGIEIASGWSRWHQSKFPQLLQLAPSVLLIALFVAGIEELVFRGFLQTTLELGLQRWLAGIVASVIFALLHLVWEQEETIPQLPGLWLMGMILVLARAADGGSLGLAWGLHAGWVWAIACLDTTQIIEYTGQINDVVTGKNQKPLAGAAGFLCMAITGIGLAVFGF